MNFKKNCINEPEGLDRLLSTEQLRTSFQDEQLWLEWGRKEVKRNKYLTCKNIPCLLTILMVRGFVVNLK
jgi:hypothetical protein